MSKQKRKTAKDVLELRMTRAVGIEWNGQAMSFAWPVKGLAMQHTERFHGKAVPVLIMLESDLPLLKKLMKVTPRRR